jgi:hypothetical protein
VLNITVDDAVVASASLLLEVGDAPEPVTEPLELELELEPVAELDGLAMDELVEGPSAMVTASPTTGVTVVTV